MPTRSEGPESQVLSGAGVATGHQLASPDTVLSKEKPEREPLRGAYFWLTLFFLVYCARPEDWIPGLHVIPLAKITGVLALLGFVFSRGRSRRGLQSLPRESLYLLLMIALLFISAVLSPVWRGGAFSRTLDFSKVFVAWVIAYMAGFKFQRRRGVFFFLTALGCVALIVFFFLWQFRLRLRGP